MRLSNWVIKVCIECLNDDIGYYKYLGKCNKNLWNWNIFMWLCECFVLVGYIKVLILYF